MSGKIEGAKNTNINATRFNTHNEAYEAYQREVLDAKVARGEAKKDTMHDLLENLHGFLKWLYEPIAAKDGGNPLFAESVVRKRCAIPMREVEPFKPEVSKDDGFWFGVELPALCESEGETPHGTIGNPVEEACDVIRRMHLEGWKVKVISKRILPVNGKEPMAHITYYDMNALMDNPKPPDAIIGHERTTVDVLEGIYIKMWCRKHLGFMPDVVSEFDKQAAEVMYYDKAKNRNGWAVCGHCVGVSKVPISEIMKLRGEG